MSDTTVFTPGSRGNSPPQTVLVQTQAPSVWRGWLIKILFAALAVSIMANLGLYSAYRHYFSSSEPPHERFDSGNPTANEKNRDPENGSDNHAAVHRAVDQANRSCRK